jgi:hypothetical protein
MLTVVRLLRRLVGAEERCRLVFSPRRDLPGVPHTHRACDVLLHGRRIGFINVRHSTPYGVHGPTICHCNIEGPSGNRIILFNPIVVSRTEDLLPAIERVYRGQPAPPPASPRR